MGLKKPFKSGGADLDALINRSITEISSSSVTSIGDYAFRACTSLTTADFPAAIHIGEYAFSTCTSLTTADFPVASATGQSAFESCSALTTVNFPAAFFIGPSTFVSCTSLTTADFPAATVISSNAFESCGVLKALLLRGNSVCSLSDVTAFISTPIGSGTGYIYVPSALIEQYKAASSWDTFAAQFRALEAYTIDGTVTGELDPSKVGV